MALLPPQNLPIFLDLGFAFINQGFWTRTLSGSLPAPKFLSVGFKLHRLRVGIAFDCLGCGVVCERLQIPHLPANKENLDNGDPSRPRRKVVTQPLKHLQCFCKAGSLLHSNKVRHPSLTGMRGDSMYLTFCRHIDPFLRFLPGFSRKHERRQRGALQTRDSLRSQVPALSPCGLEP